MESGGENARGIHAIRVLKDKKDFTLGSLLDAAYDSYLTGVRRAACRRCSTAYDKTPASNPAKAKVAEQIDSLRKWDRRWAVNSVPTSLAVFWGEEIGRRVRRVRRASEGVCDRRVHREADDAAAASRRAGGGVRYAHGEFRFVEDAVGQHQPLPAPERATSSQPFNDSGPSIPVGFTSSRWGSLASFGARPYKNTKKWYGTSGNSFVAVVEFGDSVKAKAVTAGGESGDPKVSALQRPGGAVRDRKSSRRVLLSESAEGAHRASVQSG